MQINMLQFPIHEHLQMCWRKGLFPPVTTLFAGETISLDNGEYDGAIGEEVT